MIRGFPGRRGAFLIFLAILDMVYAWALYKYATPQEAAVNALLLPWQVWAPIWGSVGLVCLGSAFLKKDRIAFSLAAALKFAWGGVSFIQWMRNLEPNGWLSTVVWVAFSATVLIISSWPEPAPLPEHPSLPERFQKEG